MMHPQLAADNLRGTERGSWMQDTQAAYARCSDFDAVQENSFSMFTAK